MNYRIRKDMFLLHWLFWSGAVWVVSGLVMLPGGIVLMLVLSALAPNTFITNLIATVYVGGIVGMVVGYTQHRLMQQFFFVNDPDWWRHSALAGVPAALTMLILIEGAAALFRQLACGGTYYCYALTQNAFYETLMGLLPMTVFISVISLIQWRTLRRYVDDAWLWVLANAIGGVLFGMLYSSLGNASLVQLVLGALVQGAVTGAVLLWLFLHKAQPLETPRRAITSVWDEAI